LLRQTWQEVTLLGLCILALISMVTGRGFEDRAAMLWMVMLLIQSLPYAATVATAVASALSNRGAGALKPLPTAQDTETRTLAEAA
jgi:cation transporter-like permease